MEHFGGLPFHPAGYPILAGRTTDAHRASIDPRFSFVWAIIARGNGLSTAKSGKPPFFTFFATVQVEALPEYTVPRLFPLLCGNPVK